MSETPVGAGAASPFQDAVVLAPLTVGGNLPFRRLCSEMGADVTVGEMAVVQKLLRDKIGEHAIHFAGTGLDLGDHDERDAV